MLTKHVIEKECADLASSLLGTILDVENYE